MKLRLPLLLPILLVAGASRDLLAQVVTGPDTIRIDHQGVGCVVAEQHPVFEAALSPADKVGAARLFFRARGDPYWYAVEMERRGEAFLGILPKPKRNLAGFDYYIDVTGTNLESSRTQEYSPRVAAGPGACRDTRMAGVLASAPVRVILPAGSPGTALVPAGFSAEGVTAVAAPGAGASGATAAGAAGGAAGAGGGAGISAATIGIVAGAIGVAAGGLALAGESDGASTTAAPAGPERFVGSGADFVVRLYSEPCTTERPYRWAEIILVLDGVTGTATMTRQATGEGTLFPCPIPGRRIPDYSGTWSLPLAVSGTSVTAAGFTEGGGWRYVLQATRSGDTISGTFTYEDGLPANGLDYTFVPPTTPFTVTKVH